MNEMKACPFCGSMSLKLIKTKTNGSKTGHSVYIKCRRCHARGPKVPIGDGDNPEQELEAAATAWDQRS